MEVRKKEIEVDFGDKKENLVVKELTGGEYNEVMDEAIVAKMTGVTPLVTFHQGKMKDLTLLKAIVSAPFEITLQNIRNLPKRIYDQIFEAVDKLNSFPESKKEA